MPKTVPYHPTIKSALGIYTGDIITTSYNTGPYIIHNVHGPITSFTGVGYLVILDHPEISLTLSIPNAKRKSTGGYINNIRQVNDRWYTAQNDEIFITRPYQAPIAPHTLFDLMEPPHEVDILPHLRLIGLIRASITTQDLGEHGIATIAMSTLTQHLQIDIGAGTIANTNRLRRKSSMCALHNPTTGALIFRITS